MRTLTITLLFLGAFCLSPATNAQEVMIGSEYEESVLSGKIVDIGLETLTLDIGEGKVVKVDTDDLDLEEDYIDDYFSPGTYVRITGSFDDQILKAEEIIRINDQEDTIIIDND